MTRFAAHARQLAAARQRAHVDRVKAGLRVFQIEADAVAVDELLHSFGAANLGELIKILVDLDERLLTRHNTTLANLLYYLRELLLDDERPGK